MQVYRGIEEVPSPSPATVLVMGNFDGVHLGHQALFRLGRERARALGAEAWALTFDPHPSQVLAPDLAPPLLCTLEQRLGRIAGQGMDATLVVSFTPELAATPPEGFVAAHLLPCGVREVVVGYDFTFGKGRSGTTKTLRELGARHGFTVHVVPPVSIDQGIVPSSTKVREYLLEGRVDAAEKLLGRPHDVVGTVVEGAGRGRTIGFPTANVATDGGVLPANGVYAVLIRLEGEAAWRGGAANIGTNPTFTSQSAVILEVHVLDYDGPSLVGRRVTVAFVKRLRAEQRFPSVDALVARIGEDVAECRRILVPRLGPGGEAGS
jgi:riboflavin kinase / FMN adenylyltransferase